MIYRRYNIADYDGIAELWDKWDFKFMPRHMLPNTGFVVLRDDNSVVSSCFLYHAKTLGGHIGWLEWFVVDKDANRTERKDSVEGMLKMAHQHLKDFNYQSCFCTLQNKNLKRKLEKIYFKVSEESAINMVWGGK